MENRNLIGRKIKGFKFKNDIHSGLLYGYDIFIGKIGVIDYYAQYTDCYKVDFDYGYAFYPAELIEQHLVDESPTEIKIGNYVWGFKFDDIHMIGYSSEMDNYIGVIGEVVGIGVNAIELKFNDEESFFYPKDEAVKHLANEDIKEFEKALNQSAEDFNKDAIIAMDKVIESETKYTCKDLSEGRVACKNDGTIDDLQTVLEYCFPDDSQIANGICSYYMRWSNNYAKWCGYEKGEIENIPTQSVKVFLKEIEAKEPQTMTITTSKEVEVNPDDIVVKNESETKESNPLDNIPIIGEGVDAIVSNYGDEEKKAKVYCKIKDVYIAILEGSPQISTWLSAKPIPKTKITRAEFESKFEIID
jgi:hypothetical protein